MVTYRKVIYTIGMHIKDFPNSYLTIEELAIKCGLDGKNLKERMLVYNPIKDYPRLFIKRKGNYKPSNKIEVTLSEHGKKYYDWLEPIYEPISDTIYIDNKLAFNDSRKSNVVRT